MRINPWKLFFGAFVPNWLMERAELTQGAKLAYARLCEYAGRKGYAFPSESALAESLGVGERQVKRYVAELVQFKLVETEKEGMGSTNKYYFLDHSWMSPQGDTYVPTEETHMSPISIKDSVKEIHKTKRTFRHSFPELMALTAERIDVARKAGVEDPIREWDTFSHYYQGNGAKMLDWDETWAYWCSRSRNFTGHQLTYVGATNPRALGTNPRALGVNPRAGYAQKPPDPNGGAIAAPRRVSTPRETRYYDQPRPDPSAGLQSLQGILKGMNLKEEK